MELISQAAFARMHAVSRKTVTVWKASGLIVMSGNAVDVEASNARLARYRPGRNTHRAKAAGLTRDALDIITPEQEIVTTDGGDIHSQGFHAGFAVALHEVARGDAAAGRGCRAPVRGTIRGCA